MNEWYINYISIQLTEKFSGSFVLLVYFAREKSFYLHNKYGFIFVDLFIGNSICWLSIFTSNYYFSVSF